MSRSQPPIDPADTNVAHLLKRTARRQPFKRAVVYSAGRDSDGRVAYAHLTFQELDQESDRLAWALEHIGITRGVRTILMIKPGPDFFTLTFALFKTGAVPVVVDPGMGIGRMVRCLQESRPQAFIGIPRAHVLRLLFPGYFKGIQHWVTVGRRWFWGGYTLKRLGQFPLKRFEPVETDPEEPAAILFTTGSTGPAKGVVYTHPIFADQIRHIQAHWRITPEEIDLPTFPLFALFDPALGMTAVIPDMDPTQPARANPARILEAIENQGVTNMFASPALLQRVGRFGVRHGVKLPSLKRVVSAGAPVSPDNIATFSSLLVDPAEVHTPYGATEAVPVLSIASREILAETAKLSEQGSGICVGIPLEGMRVCLIAIQDAPIAWWSDELRVEDGEMGEITVTGGWVTRRYFERPEADALAKIHDGDRIWHRMGDLGWRDQQGRIWFCGRKSQRVVTPGRTFYTSPCEAIFNRHPAVYRSALVGVGPPGRQAPVICIEPEPGTAARDLGQIQTELQALAQDNEMTRHIQAILFHKAFPVDVRHNAKIFREKLGAWATAQLAGKRRDARQVDR